MSRYTYLFLYSSMHSSSFYPNEIRRLYESWGFLMTIKRRKYKVYIIIQNISFVLILSISFVYLLVINRDCVHLSQRWYLLKYLKHNRNSSAWSTLPFFFFSFLSHFFYFILFFYYFNAFNEKYFSTDAICLDESFGKPLFIFFFFSFPPFFSILLRGLFFSNKKEEKKKKDPSKYLQKTSMRNIVFSNANEISF